VALHTRLLLFLPAFLSQLFMWHLSCSLFAPVGIPVDRDRSFRFIVTGDSG
jgi:hypothetical protein